MVHKTTVNDSCKTSPCHDEFRGPRYDIVSQVALAATTTYDKKVAMYQAYSTEEYGCAVKVETKETQRTTGYFFYNRQL
ncbi:hypothetical protein TNCV_2510661 [Trichonephila clavipes]|nr:hypothetical protein TNCV_2510661 [Trichonephila clavipes]